MGNPSCLNLVVEEAFRDARIAVRLTISMKRQIVMFTINHKPSSFRQCIALVQSLAKSVTKSFSHALLCHYCHAVLAGECGGCRWRRGGGGRKRDAKMGASVDGAWEMRGDEGERYVQRVQREGRGRGRGRCDMRKSRRCGREKD